MRVMVFGAGRIGMPVIRKLVRAGHDIGAHDVRAELREEVRASGARWCAGMPAHAVLTVLPGSPELHALMPGLLGRLKPGTVWVDLTSTAPDVDAELFALADARGIPHLDAGVGGGVDAARRGELTLYLGGEAHILERVRPVLAAIADPARIFHMGAAGSGHLTKLLVNLLWFGQAVATGEALLLAQRAGLDLGRLRAVLPASAAASEYVASSLPRLFAGDYLDSFGLDRCVEELDSLERLAERSGTPYELSALVGRLHREALAEFGPVDGELRAVAYLERLAGRLLRPRDTPRRRGTTAGTVPLRCTGGTADSRTAPG